MPQLRDSEVPAAVTIDGSARGNQDFCREADCGAVPAVSPRQAGCLYIAMLRADVLNRRRPGVVVTPRFRGNGAVVPRGEWLASRRSP
jgi:hypothetical protein